MVFLANPNNPTGRYLPFSEVKRLHAGLAANVLLVLDAAYAEYVRRNDYEAGIELVATSSNVVMTRTFSKIYGLAALRLGWAYCPAHVADVLNRVRGPFNISAPAIAAGAAAMADQEFVERAIAHNDTWLPWLTKETGSAGPRGHAERRQFRAGAFSRRGRAAMRMPQMPICRTMASSSAAWMPMACPVLCASSVGTEEANRGLVACLKAFLS